MGESMTAATAAWSLERLLPSLTTRGWGPELDGPANAGLRAVMNALSNLLPWESAEGRVTRNQVADVAGMTPKWASRCLRKLEDLGLITWHRGWLDKGQPRAGFIRVHKKRLAELARAATRYLDPRREQRKTDTVERINNTLRKTSIRPWKRRNPLSVRGELTTPPYTVEVPRASDGASKAVLPRAESLCPGCQLEWGHHDYLNRTKKQDCKGTQR